MSTSMRWPPQTAVRPGARRPLRFACGAALGLLALAAPGAAPAQTTIPNQMHTSLSFELHSVRDRVLLYAGETQSLLFLDTRPRNSPPPRVEFTNANQAVTLRIRDVSLFEVQEPTELDVSAGDEEEEPPPAEPEPRPPVSQDWRIEIAPSSPGEYFLQCDGGSAGFDFTDILVRSLQVLADSTAVRIEFKRPNGTRLEHCLLTVRGGQLVTTGFLDARAKTATLQVEGSKCDLDLDGGAWEGETEVFFEGVPREMRLRMPRAAGVSVQGPAATVARFDRDRMVRRGLTLESDDLDTRPCRMRLHFDRTVSKLHVEWAD